MTNRVVLGQLPSTNYGLRISLPGSDVLTCPDSELAFSSEFGRFGMVVLYGTVAYDHTTNITVPFGVTLPFIPAIQALGYYSGTQQVQSNALVEVYHDKLIFPNFGGLLLPLAGYYYRYIVFNIPVGGNTV